MKSEKKFISSISHLLTLHEKGHVDVSIGDDSAVVSVGRHKLVLTTDIMFRGTHLSKLHPEGMGWKAAVASISDLAAMGAKPVALLAAIGFEKNSCAKLGKRIVKGILSACEEYGCIYAGGDTKKAGELTICTSAVGECEAGVLRIGNVKEGDVVAACGLVGNAALGFKSKMLNLGLGEFEKYFETPEAQVKEGKVLAKFARHCAATDITDGLFFSINNMVSRKGFGAVIERLPVSKEWVKAVQKYGLNEQEIVDGGEDYVLACCIRESKFNEIKGMFEKNKLRLIEIGKVVKRKGIWLNGKKMNADGYDAFLN